LFKPLTIISAGFLSLIFSLHPAQAKFDPVKCTTSVKNSQMVQINGIAADVEKCVWQELKNGETLRKFKLCLAKELNDQGKKLKGGNDIVAKQIGKEIKKGCT